MENKQNKKKMSITQFFLIYILILAAILFGVVACNAALDSNETKKATNAETHVETTKSPEETQTSVEINAPEVTKSPETTKAPNNVSPTPKPVTDSNLPLSGLTVVIDAGHQKTPPEGKESYMPWDESKTKAKNTHGTTGVATEVEEYIVNLEIALKVRDTLEAQGAKVVMTRDNHSTSLSNQDRANIANTSNAHIAISIHCNGSDNSSVYGAESYTRGDGDGSSSYKTRSSSDLELSQKLIDEFCKATGAKNRGAKTSDAYTGINYSKIPFIILECGFMSNPEEDTKLSSEDYQQKIADGIYNFLKDSKSSLVG